jgi:hypothetical protein
MQRVRFKPGSRIYAKIQILTAFLCISLKRFYICTPFRS